MPVFNEVNSLSKEVENLGWFNFFDEVFNVGEKRINEITSLKKPIDTFINIKPICSKRVHKEAYHGPCRYQPLETLTPEAEHNSALEEFNVFKKNLIDNRPDNANILDAELVEFPEGDTIDPDFWPKIERELDSIDLFLTTYRVPGLERFNKPVSMIMPGITSVDLAAYYRHIGIDGYALYDWDDLNRVTNLLKVKKAFQETKILVLTDRLDKIPYGVYSSITDYSHLNEKYGVSTKAISLDEFFSIYKIIVESKELKSLLESAAKKLISGAKNIHINKETIIKDVAFLATVLRFFQKYDANAFSVRCFELCASKNPWLQKFVPCSTLSLLKDMGIPAGCEGDMNVLLAMMMEMYVSNKSVFMGNPVYDKEKNKLRMFHDVPGLKLHGFSSPDVEFEIVNFTHSGFGVTLRYDFSKDIGKKVTLARFNPSGDRIIMTIGEISGSFDVLTVGCKLGVEINLKNAMDMFEKSQDFGHHLAMVYGDYSNEIKKLSRIMKFEVVEC